MNARVFLAAKVLQVWFQTSQYTPTVKIRKHSRTLDNVIMDTHLFNFKGYTLASSMTYRVISKTKTGTKVCTDRFFSLYFKKVKALQPIHYETGFTPGYEYPANVS